MSARQGAVGDIPFGDVFDMDAPPPMPDMPDGPVAVSLCHDEMLRLPEFLRHHRQIGVRHFFIVDNASTDGSGAYLDAQPDVTRLFTAKPYQKLKSVFRAWPCDHYAVGRWVMEPDIDEHLVYPGWPEVPLMRLLSHWDRAGHDAVFAPMVEMYAEQALRMVQHGPDARLLDIYSFFDGDGYWVAPPKPRTRGAAPTPPYLLYGGARNRFGSSRANFRQRLGQRLVERLMDYRNPAHPRPGAWLVHRHLIFGGKRVFAMKSKLGLIRWRRGLSFPGSNHRIRAKMSLAPDWVALLHFRLMTDYARREEMWRLRKNRGEASSGRTAVTELDPMWEGSRRLYSWRDLLGAGLLRLSPELAAAIELPAEEQPA